jgi:hypothetical protein
LPTLLPWRFRRHRRRFATIGAAREYPSKDPALPSRLGRYQLYAEIGKGRTSTVFLSRFAEVEGFHGPVVLKVFHRTFSEDPMAQQ